jgi:sulfoxide reductase heme-binding subunit YedZ
MDDLVFWLLARVTGLSAFAALSLSVLSGEALRTSVFDFLASNRAIRKLHDFTTALWIPLGAAHCIALVFDRTARVGWLDLVMPFGVEYGSWQIGLGTISLDIFVVVTLTSLIRRSMSNGLWQWIHRASYAGFVALFFHAASSGTDFGAPVVSAIAWSTAAALAVVGVSRVVWGRLPA